MLPPVPEGVGSCEKGREPDAGGWALAWCLPGRSHALLRALGNSYCYSQVPSSREAPGPDPRTCELVPLRGKGVELLSDHLMFGGDMGRCL